MFTDQRHTEDDVLTDTGTSHVGETSLIKDAKRRHTEVVQKTRLMMIEWILLQSVNFLTHFMRMSVVPLYCIDRFQVSEFTVGMLVTMHMLLMGLANTYVCSAIDKHSFESLMTVRFGLLTLATLGESLAESFVSFAFIYTVASLSIVWFGVQPAYFVRMLPGREAKELTNIGITLNQGGIMLGLSLGGSIGGLFSMRSVFVISFVISGLSLIWICVFLNGQEQRIKDMQINEISDIYRDFPGLFNDTIETRFPMPFREDNPAKEGVYYLEQKAKDDHCDESITGYLCSAKSLPYWLITLRNGINAGAVSEFVNWWGVYARQVYDAPLEQSSNQYVIAIIVGMLVTAVMLKCMQPQNMSEDKVMNIGVSITVMGSIISSILFLLCFPLFEFSDFWLGLLIIQGLSGLTFPFPNILQINESPPHLAGQMFAILTAARTVIPAMQHVIIGALWSVGDKDVHPWFFTWFGILHLASAVSLVGYYVVRKCVDKGSDEDENDKKYMVIVEESEECRDV